MAAEMSSLFAGFVRFAMVFAAFMFSGGFNEFVT
jgi:hypothetical protein